MGSRSTSEDAEAGRNAGGERRGKIRALVAGGHLRADGIARWEGMRRHAALAMSRKRER